MSETADSNEETIEVEFEPAEAKSGRWWRVLAWSGAALVIVVSLAAASWAGWQIYRRASPSPTVAAAPPTSPSPTVTTAPTETTTTADDRNDTDNRIEALESALTDTTRALANRTANLEAAYRNIRSALATRGAALANLNQRLARTMDRLERLENSQVAGVPADDSAPAPEQHLAPLDETVPPLAPPGAVPPLASPGEGSQAVRIGLAALEAALKTDAPFLNLYTMVIDIMPYDPDLAALESVAQFGAPLLTDLEARFLAYRESAAAGARARRQQNKSLWRRILDSFIAFDADDDGARLDRAGAALRASDFAGLEQALAPLATDPTVADLLAGARRRAKADRATFDIRAKMQALARDVPPLAEPDTGK